MCMYHFLVCSLVTPVNITFCVHLVLLPFFCDKSQRRCSKSHGDGIPD